jgi:hypothetical protein
MAKLTLNMIILLISLFSFLGTALAAEMELPPYKGGPSFESMKSLAGHWEGAKVTGDKEEPVKVEYKVTSNGSTIIETLMPGTKYEMVSVYHEKGGKLSMTHYCSIGNQPQMDLVKTDGKDLEFAFSTSNEIDVAKEGHMHDLTLTMVDKDHLIHNWTMYKEGKDGGTTTLKLARVQ